MAKNIDFKKILKMFSEYPSREYPDPIKIDPRSKKPIDPVTLKVEFIILNMIANRAPTAGPQ
jgi:hypothetical protein